MDPNILTELSLQVTLDEDAIRKIKNEEPWYWFPLSVSLFCSNRQFLHLGEKYFTNPPRYLLDELKELYKSARKQTYCIDKINEYCVLVYIMTNHQLDLNDTNFYIRLTELYQTLFNYKYIPRKPGTNEDQKIATEEVLQRMNNKYLKLHEGIYEFIHPCLLKAVSMSSDCMANELLQNGSLHDITECVRSKDCTGLKNELFIKVDENYHQILCERLMKHAFEDKPTMRHVVQYIYTYWRSPGNKLLKTIFKYIEFNLLRSLGIHTGNLQPSVVNENFSETKIKAEVQITFCNVTVLVEEITYIGRDPWIYGHDTADVIILSGLITAAKWRYDRKQTLEILLSLFRNRILYSESFVKILSNPLDIYGNTFFHYLMLFKKMEESDILYMKKYIFDTKNVKDYTPLDIAAYLGKGNVLEDLNLKTDCTKKLRDRLKRLARSGQVEFCDENSKRKVLDRGMVNKTMDDGASSEKLQSDEKKEVKDESHNKNKPNKTEKDDTNNSELEFIDVLCFDGDMIKFADFGKIKDYREVFQLLSK